MRQYWDSGHTDVSMMAEDVVFTMMADGSEYHGPEGVREILSNVVDRRFKGGVHL
jgi:hypothetical protein